MSAPIDFARVHTAAGMLQANLVKAMLEAAGLPVLVYGESAATVYGFTVGDMGRVELWVPADRLAEAEEIVADFEKSGDESRSNDAMQGDEGAEAPG